MSGDTGDRGSGRRPLTGDYGVARPTGGSRHSLYTGSTPLCSAAMRGLRSTSCKLNNKLIAVIRPFTHQCCLEWPSVLDRGTRTRDLKVAF